MYQGIYLNFSAANTVVAEKLMNAREYLNKKHLRNEKSYAAIAGSCLSV